MDHIWRWRKWLPERYGQRIIKNRIKQIQEMTCATCRLLKNCPSNHACLKYDEGDGQKKEPMASSDDPVIGP